MAMRDQHLLGVPAGDNVIRLLPPLVTTAEESRDGLRRIELAAEQVRQKAAAIA
ncbi:acetylornithine transaminase protein [compost metagenome]